MLVSRGAALRVINKEWRRNLQMRADMRQNAARNQFEIIWESPCQAHAAEQYRVGWTRTRLADAEPR